MLNTFRVIFVDNNGVVQDDAIANCNYLQTGEPGYYVFDHGQPTGIAGNGNYAYDNRTINTWYRKYGIQPSIFADTIPDNPPLWPPPPMGLEGALYETQFGEVKSGLSGAIFSSSGMTTAAKNADGSGLEGRVFDENDMGGVRPPGSMPWEIRNYKKDVGVTLDLRTPTYFFNDSDGTGNKDKRNISRTENIEFDTESDLIFTPFPSETNPPVNEIDLSEPTENPQWIYIGLMGAGGPGGAKIQSMPGQFEGSFSCNLTDDWNDDGIGLCSFWRDNRALGELANNCISSGGGSSETGPETVYPIMDFQYGGPSGWGQNGGRVGVFLKTCKLGLNDTGTARKTLVVRINQLGRGGVEQYNNAYREYDETDVNRAKTVFPEFAERKTSITIYDAGNDRTQLGNEDKLLTVEVSGGYAEIMQVLGAVDSTCGQGFGRPFFCASCSGPPVDNSGNQDDVVSCQQDCLPWHQGGIAGSWTEPNIYNQEIYFSAADSGGVPNIPPVPTVTVTRHQLAQTDNWQENRDYIVTDELSRTPQGDEAEGNFSFGRPGFGNGKYFAPELEDIGIISEKDWYRKAGGIQETPETVTIDTLDSTSMFENSFFGVDPDFIFYGGTKYVLEQDLTQQPTSGEVQVPLYPSFYDFTIPTSITGFPEYGEYYRFDSVTSEYVLLEDFEVDLPGGQGQTTFTVELQYKFLNADPSSIGQLGEIFGDFFWQNVSKCKAELKLPVNSQVDSFGINKPTSDPEDIRADFAFHRSNEELIPTPSLGGRLAATMIDPAGNLSHSSGSGGIPGVGTTIPIGNGADDWAEGAGGNGGAIFVAWGEDINGAAEQALINRNGLGPEQNPGETQLSEFVLSGNDGGSTFLYGKGPWANHSRFRPNALETLTNPPPSDTYYKKSPRFPTGPIPGFNRHKEFVVSDRSGGGENPAGSDVLGLSTNQKVRSGYDKLTPSGSYKQVGDPNAKGYDVAPIARFTELPELTREGDFYLTLQAYHMEGIHKVTFVMDKGWGVDVYTPVKHPDDLGTNYEGSASGLGKDYEEYMVKVSTEDMENNSVHEIRAIVWPNSGYPLVLQGEKQDSHRFIKGSSTGGLGEEPEQELFKVTPTTYPWVTNKYPEMMGEYNPNQNDVNGNPLTIAPNPDTGGITLIDEPSWYTAANQEQERLDIIGQVPSGVVDTSDMLDWYPPYENDQIRTWQAVPGEPVDNFEGHVDDLGKPAWWIPGSETNNVGYHGFWFRYQKSGDATVPADTGKYPDEGKRRVLYVDSSVDVNSSGRDTNLLGTIDHPYQSLDEVMDALETGDHPEIATGTYEIEDYFSAKLILLGQKDSPADGEPKGRIYKWWGSDNLIGREFQNCLDHNESRESAQNPSCQVLTVEARKVDSVNGIPVPPSVGPPIDFHPDQESSEIYDKEVVLLSFDGGWGKEFSDDPSDPSKDNGGTPKNANVHYKNFRFITDLPTANTDDMFKVSANVRRSNDWGPRYQDGGLVEHWRFKAPTSIIENCKFNSWSEWGANSQLSYTDKSGLTDNSGKVYWAGPPTPGVAPVGECSRNSCTYDETNHAPLDRSRMRSIDVTLLPGIDGVQSPGVHPVVWEKIGKNMEYIWQGDKFPDPENDVIGPNRQLLDERLPGYDTLLRWSFGNPDEIAEQKAAINNGDEPVDYPDGLYVSTVRDGRGPEGTIPGTKIDLSINTERQWRPLEVTVTNDVVFGEGVPNQRRRTGTLRNDSVFTRALTEGYPGNVDLYSSNCIVSKYGAGRRFVGVNLVKNYVESNCAGDTTARSTSGLVNCVIDIRSMSYFPGKRLASNGGNTVHGDIAQIDASDLGWMDNRIIADILMPNNASQLAHMSKAIPRRRNSKYDIWRASHKFRNWAFVNVISDSGQASNTWNLFESFDHLYIRGHRLKATHIRFDSNARHGIPYLGERYDNRVSHLYLADMNSGQVGIETTRTEDGVQGAYNVVDTVSANENYKGYARMEPAEIDGTPGNYVTTPGVFKYAWADEKGRGSDNTGFWPQQENPSYGGVNDEDPERDDDKKYFPTAIPANQIYWYPVYNSQDLTTPGNYTVDPNTSSVDDTNFDDILRSSLGQYCDASNSIIRFDTCIYSNWGNGPDKMVQGNIETNFFNQNGVPPIEQAYLIQGDDPTTINHIGRSEAVGAPNGVPTKNKNTFQIEDDNGNLQQLTYITTYAGNSGELLSMSQGFTAPRGWNAIDPTTPDGFWNDVKIDLIQNVRFVPTADTNNGGEQWPRAGKVVDAHYLYDRETFKDIVANGGWNYTPELGIDYTPHKL